MSKRKTDTAKGASKQARSTEHAEPPKASPFLDDPRLPPVGTEIVRKYKDREYRVLRGESAFTYDGREFRSISAIASEILGGVSVNGFLWFGLVPRAKPAKEKPAKAMPAETPASEHPNEAATPAGQRRAIAAALGKGSKPAKKAKGK